MARIFGKFKALGIMLLVVAFVVAGCGQNSSSSNQGGGGSSTPSQNTGGSTGSTGAEPIKIGIAMPVTGPSALYGNQTIDGSKMAAKMINEEGGILGGRQIELLIEDDKSSPEEGVKAFTKLIEVEKVHAMTGGANSSVSIAAAKVAANRILNIMTTAKAPAAMDDRDPYRFRLNTTNDMDGKLFHAFVKDELKPQTVAVLVENTDYGQAEIKALQTNWADANAPKIVKTEFFELTDTDFTNALTNLKAANAEALYVVGSTIEINSAIFTQAAQLGFNNLKLLAPGQLNTTFVELAGDAANGVISADVYMSLIDNEMNKVFAEKFRNEYNREPGKMEMLGFEAIWLVAKAMDKAGSATDYDKIAEVLENSEWETPRGTVTFTDGQAHGSASVLTVKDKQIVPYQ
jgi:branched-chain amino acid transport system substrate-binding protein